MMQTEKSYQLPTQEYLWCKY